MRNIKTQVVIETPIFERGDLIACKNLNHNTMYYGVVVEDQNPAYLDEVVVRSIATGDIVRWNGVQKGNVVVGPCKFISHLDNAAIFN